MILQRARGVQGAFAALLASAVWGSTLPGLDGQALPALVPAPDVLGVAARRSVVEASPSAQDGRPTKSATALARFSPPVDVVLTEQAKLAGIGDARGDPFERFGSAVAIEGDTAVVGAPGHDLPDWDDGAAYVFLRTGNSWALAAKLSPSDPGTHREFGSAVAISGDTIVVGTAGFAPTAAVYVFVRSGAVWTEQARFTASDTQFGDRFGVAVAISADTLVVGAPQATTGFGSRSGSVYVFTRSGNLWTEQQELLPVDLA